MAASDQLRFRITRFPLAYCGLLAAVNINATLLFFSATDLSFVFYGALFLERMDALSWFSQLYPL
jgi:hypothetical protein